MSCKILFTTRAVVPPSDCPDEPEPDMAPSTSSIWSTQGAIAFAVA